MFGIGFTRELERTIATRDNSIKLMIERKVALEDKLHAESLKVVRLAAENATLKQRIDSLVDDIVKCNETCSIYAEECAALRQYKDLDAGLDKTLSPVKLVKSNIGVFELGVVDYVAKTEKPKVHPNLQAYYNRGKNKKSKNK